MNNYAPPPQMSHDPASGNGMSYYQSQPGLVPAPGAGAFQFGAVGPSNESPLFADDFTLLGGDDLGDNGDPKRRRIARACDMCRKKKIKCDGKMPACTHCQNYKTECIFTLVEKKRNPPKGAKYIEGLENRLGRMESLLRLSGILAEDGDEEADLGILEKRLADKKAKEPKETPPTAENGGMSSRQSVTSSQGQERDKTASAQGSPRPTLALNDTPVASPGPAVATRSEEEVEALSDMMCSLVTNNCGETRYIGSSSGFSIFSPKGIQWVNEKTGDTSFQDMISTAAIDDNKWIHWKPDVFRDIFSRRVFKPLPPKAEALSLLRDYFQNFNCMFPLFHEPTFMHLVEKHYSHDPYEGSGWWASLNVALAIAHRLRVMSNLVPQEEDQKAWGYLKNALAVQTELTIRNTDLLSVQALLGMSLFLQGTPNPQPSFFLVAAAIRLSHSIGLHKRGSGFNLSPIEIEQRKRVFWIAYMLDRDICLRSGRPPIQDDDDMNVELPSEDPKDNIGNIPLADGKGKVNLFRLMCTFAVIESKVYKQLYSVKASKQSDGELLNTIGELDKELEDWKDNIPIDFRPEHEIKASHTPLILHVVVLHFAYYNCLTTIHRMSVHHGYWTSRLSNYAIQGLNARPLNPRVFSSAALCVSAARASINLVEYIPQGDFACVWLILYYPVSALVTLFANILQNPQDSRARSDLKLMNRVVAFLSKLSSDEANGSVRRMLNVCAEFERIAKVVLDKADKESHSRRKRKQADTADAPAVNKPREAEASHTRERSRSATRKAPASESTAPTATGASVGTGQTPNVHSPPDGAGNAANSQQRSSSHTRSPYSTSSHLSSSNMSNGNSGVSPMFSQGMSPQPSSTLFPGSSPFNGFPDNLAGFSPNPGMPAAGADPLNLGGSFQQPFVPQDLWQMPMTLEWDWADLTGYGGGMAGVEGMHGGLATTGVEDGVQPGDNLSGTMGLGIQRGQSGSRSGSSNGTSRFSDSGTAQEGP